MMRYAAALEYLGHAVSRPGHFPRATAGREVDVTTRQLLKKPGIVLVGHIVDRVIEVEVVIVHPVHRVALVVNAGERVATEVIVRLAEERGAMAVVCGMDERRE